MAESFAIARVDDLPPGTIRTFMTGDMHLALANIEGTIYAIEDVCTHDGGPLGDGELVEHEVECPRLVAYAWARRTLKQGDEIIASVMEHHSNLVPWQMVAEVTGAVLRFVDITPDGFLDMDCYHRLLNERTRLVALSHCSNVLGTITPVADLARAAHAHGALLDAIVKAQEFFARVGSRARTG